jgi:hypothetical protein
LSRLAAATGTGTTPLMPAPETLGACVRLSRPNSPRTGLACTFGDLCRLGGGRGTPRTCARARSIRTWGTSDRPAGAIHSGDVSPRLAPSARPSTEPAPRRHITRPKTARGFPRAVSDPGVAQSGRAGVRARMGRLCGPDGGRRRCLRQSPEPMLGWAHPSPRQILLARPAVRKESCGLETRLVLAHTFSRS